MRSSFLAFLVTYMQEDSIFSLLMKTVHQFAKQFDEEVLVDHFSYLHIMLNHRHRDLGHRRHLSLSLKKNSGKFPFAAYRVALFGQLHTKKVPLKILYEMSKGVEEKGEDFWGHDLKYLLAICF